MSSTVGVPARGSVAGAPGAPDAPGAPGARTAGLRAMAVAVTVVLLGVVHLRHRPATLCPLRALTGVPCPFCGGTTAAVRLGHGQLRGALAASPLAVGLLVLWPAQVVVGTPRLWRRRSVRWTVLAVGLGAAELWQLLRFHVLSL